MNKRKKISTLLASVIYCPNCYKQVGMRPSKRNLNMQYVSFACRDCGTQFRICSHCHTPTDMDVHENDAPITEELENMLSADRDNEVALLEFNRILDECSEQERAVLELLRDGYTFREIGTQLGFSHEKVSLVIRAIRDRVKI